MAGFGATDLIGGLLFPKDYVNIGGLGGLPFGGRSAFRTVMKRVPDSCCLLLVSSTHTGFDPAGNLGFVQRLDTKTMQVSPPLQTCRAGMKAFRILLADPDYSLTELEQQDKQYNYIFNLIKHHFDHISECDFVTEGIGRVAGALPLFGNDCSSPVFGLSEEEGA